MLRNKFMQFMYGRSGSDQLGLFCLITAMVLNLAGSLLAHLSAALYAILTVLSLVLLAWTIYRMFSRNVAKRRAENASFMRTWNKVKSVFKPRPDAKTHARFKCPKCKQAVRVPKGKGKIMITCPKCGEKFSKKT